MSTRITKDDCNNFKSLDKALTQSPNFKSKRNGKGSHVVWTSKSGGSVTAYHKRENYPKGTKSGIWRLVVVAGFAVVIGFCWLGVLVQVQIAFHGAIILPTPGL